MSDKFTRTVIVCNIIMALLAVVPGVIELILLHDQSLEVNLFYIEHQPGGYPPPPTIAPPWPNLFTIFLIVDLAVNAYFLYRLKSRSADEKMK